MYYSLFLLFSSCLLGPLSASHAEIKQLTHFHAQHYIYHCLASSLDSAAFSVALFAFAVLKRATLIVEDTEKRMILIGNFRSVQDYAHARPTWRVAGVTGVKEVSLLFTKVMLRDASNVSAMASQTNVKSLI